VVTFSNPGIKATNVMMTDNTNLTATLNITPGALAAAAAAPNSSAPQQATNTYAIFGSHLRGLKIIYPSGVVIGPGSYDTVMIFSLTDKQVKETKEILLQHDMEEPIKWALPVAPAAASSTPAAPTRKALTSPIAINLSSVPISGTGMGTVVDIQYQDKPLLFTSSSDTALTLQLPTCPAAVPSNGCVWPTTGPAPTEIDVVFFYADKSQARYTIPVQPAAPK
jgi:hypothetical protein